MARAGRTQILASDILSDLTRRKFCETVLSGGALCLASRLSGATAQASPAVPQKQEQVYDLLIRGGTVIDPSQNLNGEFDVAISGGRIAEVARNIPSGKARETL